MNYDEAIAELRSARYCCRKLIRINQDIEVLEHQMTGLARSGVVLSPQQAKSPLPLPHYQHNPDSSPVALIEAVEAKRKEASAIRKRVLGCNWVEDLDAEDKDALIQIAFLRKTVTEVAEEKGYTRQGFYKHLNSILREIC